MAVVNCQLEDRDSRLVLKVLLVSYAKLRANISSLGIKRKICLKSVKADTDMRESKKPKFKFSARSASSKRSMYPHGKLDVHEFANRLLKVVPSGSL